MICTAAERDALMAAVLEYGRARCGFGWAASRDNGGAAGLATVTSDHHLSAIRAMLAPDDAVLRLTEDERDLLETIAWCGVRNGSMTVGAYEGLTDGKDYSAIAQSLIDRFDAVLRGEATRDENA